MKIYEYLIQRKVIIVIIGAFLVSVPLGFYGGRKLSQYMTTKFDTEEQTKEQKEGESLEEKLEKSEKVKGKLDTAVEFADYEVDDGFEAVKYETHSNSSSSTNNPSSNNSSSSKPNSNKPNSDKPSGSSGNTSSKPNYSNSGVNKSSLSGSNISIVEGTSFNPLRDLQLKATDKDGTDITHKIKIKENNVNEYKPNVYTVKVVVTLNDNSSLEKTFTVNVTKAPFMYNLHEFKSRTEYVEKGGNFDIDLSIDFLNKNVVPEIAEINGKKYKISKNKVSIFRNNKDYFINLKAGNNAGKEYFKLEKLHLSNGNILNMNAVADINVLKSEPTIENVEYEEVDNEGNITVKFELNDIDNSASNIKAVLYKPEYNPISEQRINEKRTQKVDFKVESNGEYKLKIFADINRLPGKDDTQKEKVLNSKYITISKIDKSEIIGNDNAEVSEGDMFEPFEDLNLTAIDVDGKDITKDIVIESKDIDTNVVGIHNVTVSVINKNKSKLERTFNVNVKPIESEFIESTRGRARILDGAYSVPKQKAKNTIGGSDTNGLKTTIPIDGVVLGDDGSLPAGRIEVEVPTSMAFMVDQDGKLHGAHYNINNKSDVAIEVFVSAFSETRPNLGITVKQGDIDSGDSRGTVNLDIHGNSGKARLYHQGNMNTKLSEISPKSIDTLVLTGKAGKGIDHTIDESGAVEDFIMSFRIKKK